MKIPFHTENCREGWGCHPNCPVLVLTKQYETLLATQPKEPDNERA